MKVLFVCSGNSENFEIAPFIKAQGDSLIELGVEVAYFPVVGKGLAGYFNAARRLRKYLKNNHYDIIHAHFSLSGWAAVWGAQKTPIVLSLMGDDAQGNYVGINKIELKSRFYVFSTKLIQPFVKVIISKSPNLEKHVFLKQKSIIIPNGIDTLKFKTYLNGYKQELGFDERKQYVLFLGSKSRKGKNMQLAQEAVSHIGSSRVELVNPYPIPHNDIPKYLNAVDVLVVPSFMEGSPNVIKEAMACNCPIVATDVGDIKWVMGDTEGCFIASFEVRDFADKIESALEFSHRKGRTKGEQRIRELKLDSDSIARRVLNVYKKILNEKA